VEPVEHAKQLLMAQLEGSRSKEEHPLKHVAEGALESVRVALGFLVGEQASELGFDPYVVGFIEDDQRQAHIERAERLAVQVALSAARSRLRALRTRASKFWLRLAGTAAIASRRRVRSTLGSALISANGTGSSSSGRSGRQESPW